MLQSYQVECGCGCKVARGASRFSAEVETVLQQLGALTMSGGHVWCASVGSRQPE